MLPRSCVAALILAASAQITHAADDPYGDPLPAGAKTRLGTIRYRFGGSYAPIISPDGKTIFYAPDGWTISRFEITGAAVGGKQTGPSREPPLVFSADGSRALTTGGTTVVWDVGTGKTVATLKRTVHFFDRGQPLADLSGDGKVVVMGVGRNRDKKEMESADVLVWDVDANKEIARFTPPQNEFAYVAIAPDAKTIATWGGITAPAGKVDPDNPGQYATFFDAANGKPLAKVRVPGYNPTAVAFSRDGKLAAVAGAGMIEVIDPRSGASKHTLLGRSGAGRTLAFSPDGTTLFATSANGVVQRWRIADGERLSSTEPPLPELQNASVRATGADRGVAWATRSIATIVWEVPSGKLLGPQDGHFNRVERLTVTPDSKFVLTSSSGQTLKWELATGKLIGPAPGHPWPGRSSVGAPALAELAPGGARALIYDYGGYGIHDGATGLQQFVIPTIRPTFNKASFTADGSKVITILGSYDGKQAPTEVSLWDATAAKRLFTVELPGHVSSEAALTPDGKHLVTSSRAPVDKGHDYVITTWELPGGAKKGEYREGAAYGNAPIATAADNRTAAVVVSKGKVLRFDLATGKTSTVASGFESASTPPLFSPDGKSLVLLASSSFGRPASVTVLDWETGKTRHAFLCPDGGPISAAFSPDGRYLVTGTNMATAFVWELSK